MDGKYKTRNGKPVRILAVDLKINSEICVAYTIESELNSICFTKIDGFHYSGYESEYDLIEVGNYDHIKKGDVVLVWDDKDINIKFINFFVKSNNYGVIASSSDDLEQTFPWDNCELYSNDRH